jgi:hypothetical protein
MTTGPWMPVPVSCALSRLCAGDGLLNGLRIGLYEHSSAASEALARILSEGATVIRLGHSDRFIPVDTEAVSDETRALAAGWVRSARTLMASFPPMAMATGPGGR